MYIIMELQFVYNIIENYIKFIKKLVRRVHRKDRRYESLICCLLQVAGN